MRMQKLYVWVQKENDAQDCTIKPFSQDLICNSISSSRTNNRTGTLASGNSEFRNCRMSLSCCPLQRHNKNLHVACCTSCKHVSIGGIPADDDAENREHKNKKSQEEKKKRRTRRRRTKWRRWRRRLWRWRGRGRGISADTGSRSRNNEEEEQVVDQDMKKKKMEMEMERKRRRRRSTRRRRRKRRRTQQESRCKRRHVVLWEAVRQDWWV